MSLLLLQLQIRVDGSLTPAVADRGDNGSVDIETIQVSVHNRYF
jgi:hypothetical protein